MNAYFFKMNKAERNDILDQHRKVYDGYVTTYGQQINQQPLYVQDFANDKDGLVVSNKGVVKPYTNMRINEMKYDGMDTGLFSEESDDYTYMTPTDEDFNGLDTIGDGSDDLEYGTMGDSSDWYMEMGEEEDEETEDDEEIYLDLDDTGEDEDFYDEVDDDKVEQLQEQLNKTLDMFKRFKKY